MHGFLNQLDESFNLTLNISILYMYSIFVPSTFPIVVRQRNLLSQTFPATLTTICNGTTIF